VRWVASAVVALSVCTSVFGLERPVHEVPVDSTVRDTVTDTTVITDMAVDALACPAAYVMVTGSTSRYRIVTTTGTVGARHDDCNDDLSGATHLAVFETVGELAEVAATVPSNSVRLWVGAVQPRDQTKPDGGWTTVVGGGVPANLWDTGEPDDSDGVETNDENFAFLEPNTGKLKDKDPPNLYGAICECDGKPLDVQVDGLFPP